MKCLCRLDLPFDSFLATVVSHVFLLASSVVFHYVFVVPNRAPRVDSFSIAMRSWPN
jgi:hypothetical protein